MTGKLGAAMVSVLSIPLPAIGSIRSLNPIHIITTRQANV